MNNIWQKKNYLYFVYVKFCYFSNVSNTIVLLGNKLIIAHYKLYTVHISHKIHEGCPKNKKIYIHSEHHHRSRITHFMYIYLILCIISTLSINLSIFVWIKNKNLIFAQKKSKNEFLLFFISILAHSSTFEIRRLKKVASYQCLLYLVSMWI